MQFQRHVTNSFQKTAKRRSTLPKWFSPQVRHLLNKICSLKRKLRSHSSPSLLAKRALLEEDLPNEIDLAKAEYVSHLRYTNANNWFKLFKHLSSLKATPTIPASAYYNDLEVSDRVRKCDLFMSSSTLHSQTVSLYLLQLSHYLYHLIHYQPMNLLRRKSTSSSPPLTPQNLKVLMASLQKY